MNIDDINELIERGRGESTEHEREAHRKGAIDNRKERIELAKLITILSFGALSLGASVIYVVERDGINQSIAILAQSIGVVAEKDDVVAEKDDVVAKKDDVVAEKGDVVAEKDDVVAEKDDVVAEKDDVFTEKGDVVAEKGDVSAQKSAIIAQEWKDARNATLGVMLIAFLIAGYMGIKVIWDYINNRDSARQSERYMIVAAVSGITWLLIYLSTISLPVFLFAVVNVIAGFILVKCEHKRAMIYLILVMLVVVIMDAIVNKYEIKSRILNNFNNYYRY